MAITFTNTRTFATVNTTAILNNQQTTSMFFWFRYEPGGSNQVSQISYSRIVGRLAPNGPYVLFDGFNQAANGFVSVYFSYRTQTGAYCDARVPLAIGVAYPILMVFSQGQQTLYLPGQTISTGTNTGALPDGNWGFGVGGYPPGSPCVFTVGDVNVWNGYAATAADYSTLVQGGNPTSIGGSATARYRWTLAGTTGATPTLGDPGLAEAYAGVYNLSQADGNGSVIETWNLGGQWHCCLSVREASWRGLLLESPESEEIDPEQWRWVTSPSSPEPKRELDVPAGAADYRKSAWNTVGLSYSGWRLACEPRVKDGHNNLIPKKRPCVVCHDRPLGEREYCLGCCNAPPYRATRDRPVRQCQT